jgi:hypothetical protein
MVVFRRPFIWDYELYTDGILQWTSRFKKPNNWSGVVPLIYWRPAQKIRAKSEFEPALPEKPKVLQGITHCRVMIDLGQFASRKDRDGFNTRNVSK